MLMTGDYKFDQTPVDGPPTDVSRLAELGRGGCCCSAATRPTPTGPGPRPRSRASGPACWSTFSAREGRIIVTSFASNIHRVQQVIDAAVQLDRRVAVVGRSMRKNFNIASNWASRRCPRAW